MTSLFAELERRYGDPERRMSRRGFLAAAAAASAAACAPLRPRRTDGAPRVIVVGAGFAGLSCALELADQGCDVVVLEAQRRVGGRVLSFDDVVPGAFVEGGGELIGANHPQWLRLAARFGLELREIAAEDDAVYPLVLGGRRLDGGQAEALYVEMDFALATMTVEAVAVREDEPWTTPGAAALDARSTAEWLADVPCSSLGRRGVRAQLEADNGCALESQSLLANLTQVKGGGLESYWTESEVFRCANGNQSLAVAMATELGSERVLTGAAVRSIVDDGREVVVRCADGRRLSGDVCVLAVPPPTWRRIDVSPSLPAGLAPQCGVNVKYLARVKRRFWRDAGLAPESLGDGFIGWTWEATDGVETPGDACLVAFSGGPAAEACRAGSAAERHRRYAAELERVYPGFAANVLGTPRFMDWPGFRWTGTGYAFPAPGELIAQGPLLAAAHGRLHFAGEHACPKFIGYMEGALQSGASVAARLLRSAEAPLAHG